MNLADSRMDCLRGCLATLSVRIALQKYSKIHEKACKFIICEIEGVGHRTPLPEPAVWSPNFANRQFGREKAVWWPNPAVCHANRRFGRRTRLFAMRTRGLVAEPQVQ